VVKNKSLKIVLFLIFYLLITSNGKAQNSTARFLYWQPSAMSKAIGGVGTAYMDNAFAVYYKLYFGS
jgi:hypothetical protein